MRPAVAVLTGLILVACSADGPTDAAQEGRASARVQVIDDLGAPLSLTVELVSPTGATVSATTSADSGLVTFAGLRPGRFTARVLAPPAFRVQGGVEQGLDVREAIVVRTTFIAELRSGVVSGMVSDSSGAIVGSVPFELRDAEGMVMTTRSNSQGAFQFTRVPVGRYTLALTDTTLRPRRTAEFDLQENAARQELFVVGVPTNGSWATVAEMRYPRGGHATVQVGEDVYVLGGERAWTELEPRVERFRNGTWELVTQLPIPVVNTAAAAVGGRIYVIGGVTDETTYGRATAAVQVFDTSTGTWSAGPPFPEPLGYHSAVTLDGRIHVISRALTPNHRHHVLDPVAGTWTSRSPFPYHAGQAATVLNGKLFVIAGEMASIYDPGTDTWTDVAPARFVHFHSAAVTRDDRVYVFGGYGTITDSSVPHAEVYDPATNRWSELRPMPNPRAYFGAAALRDGIYLFGGAPRPLGPYFSATVSRFRMSQ